MFCIFYSCLLSITAVAEVAYVAVGDVHLRYKTEETDEQATGVCELWNALLTERLSGFESVNIVERENLSVILRELELSLSALSEPNSLLQVQKLIGADFLVLSELTAERSTFILSSRLVSAKDGLIEKDFSIKIDVNNIHGQVDNAAAKIKESAINHLKASDITHLIAIADFENKSPLSRNDWMETSVPRKLRRALKGLPGVRILEREEVDLLLEEVRLSKGGLIQKVKKPPDKNTKYARRFLVTGSYDEYQPLDQKARLEFSVNLSDIDSQRHSIFKIDFRISEFHDGLKDLEDSLIKQIFSQDKGNITKVSRPDSRRNIYEAKVNFDKALRLMGYNSLKDLQALGHTTGWTIRSYTYFSQTRHPGDKSPIRRANILRAVRYLKTSIMLNNNDPYAKELLAVLLVDGQISNASLALELTQEIAARYRGSGHETGALHFLLRLLGPVKGRPYFDLLLEKYPRSYAAQTAISSVTRSLANRKDIPLPEKMEKAKELMQKALQWHSRSHFVAAQMQTWFKLVRNCGKDNDFGEDLVNEMIRDYPRAALAICRSWAYQWDYVEKNAEKTIYWCRRGLALSEGNNGSDVRIDIERDHLSFMLGRNLFEQGQYESAAASLKDCDLPNFGKRACFLRSVCLFKLGRYTEALVGFESLGRFNTDGSAVEWAQKTRARLGTVVNVSHTEGAEAWITPEIPLRGRYISALASDGKNIWIGAIHPAATLFGEGHNLIMLEQAPGHMQKAKQTGGLIRYNTRTEQTTQFEVGKEISGSWITDVHIQGERVWIGTYGEGLDVYDKETDSWSNLSEKDGLPSNYVRSLDGDEAYLWIGTGRYGKGAVARLDLKTNELHTFLPRDYQPQQPVPTTCVSDIEVTGDRIWCASGKAGVAVYNQQDNRWMSLPNSGSFYSIESVAAFNDRLWFGGREGNRAIYSCNLDGSDWRVISNKDGLPETSIFAIETNGDHLLLGTYGLMVLDNEGSLTTYGLRSGHHWNFAATELLGLANQIWIGTRHGVKILKIP
jgi:tetratricopeptide (TPR) repeat protein